MPTSEGPTFVAGLWHALWGGDVTDFHPTRVDRQWIGYRKAQIGLSIAFTICSLLFTTLDLGRRKESYLDAVKAFPPGVSEYADGLADFMFFNDVALFIVAIMSLVLTVRGFFNIESDASASSGLVRLAWACNTAVPFLGLIIVAGRSQIDWDGAVFSLCENTFLATMGSDGKYPEMWSVLNGMSGGASIVVDPAWAEASAEESISAFCREHGWDWGEKFFGPLPTSSFGDVVQPISLDDMDALCAGSMSDIALDPTFPDASKVICYSNHCVTGYTASGSCPAGCSNNLCLLTPMNQFEVVTYMVTLQISALMASAALRNSEFIVGVVMGLYGMKTLLPAAVSVITGMMGGVDNARLLFPTDAILSRLSMFTVVISLPLLSAFLATAQQVVGGWYLSPSVLLLLASGCCIFWGSKKVLNPLTKVPDLQATLNRQTYVRVLLIALSGLFAAFFLLIRTAASKLMEYVEISSLLSGFGVLVFIADSLARSSLTKVVSLDLILFGLWKSHDDTDNVITEEMKEKRLAGMRSFDVLFLDSKGKSSASAAVAP